MIVFAFPGTGKSTLAKKYADVADLELSEIKYDNSQVAHLTKEERKSVKRPLKDKNYKKIYVEKAMSLHHQGKIVLVALNFLPSILRELRRAQDENYHIFIPEIRLRKDYLERYKQRGNNDIFIREVMTIWYPTLLALSVVKLIYPSKITHLQKDQVLEDYLSKIKKSETKNVNVLNCDKFLKKCW